MKVNLIFGASHAYAVINAGPRSMDVRLEPGRSAAQSLRESAGELRRKAADCILRASLMEEAAIEIDQTPRSYDLRPTGTSD